MRNYKDLDIWYSEILESEEQFPFSDREAGEAVRESFMSDEVYDFVTLSSALELNYDTGNFSIALRNSDNIMAQILGSGLDSDYGLGEPDNNLR